MDELGKIDLIGNKLWEKCSNIKKIQNNLQILKLIL
jgi:hypothetical protein